MRKLIGLLVVIVAVIFFSVIPAYAASPAVGNVLAGKRIAIDPGHGGSDAGAVGPSGLQEKDVTLAVGLDLRQLLTTAGARVFMTRTADADVAYPFAPASVELQARVDVASRAKADMLISIHIDSFVTPDAGGTTTYYSPKTVDDNRLANSIQQALVGRLGLEDRGAQQAGYYILRRTDMPAVLTEAAFISNPAEEKLLRDSYFVHKIALGIYQGILQYFA
jgi:N-acetylmuramoyl-L-alanine amidase